jgi:hypothetical protein
MTSTTLCHKRRGAGFGGGEEHYRPLWQASEAEEFTLHGNLLAPAMWKPSNLESE